MLAAAIVDTIVNRRRLLGRQLRSVERRWLDPIRIRRYLAEHPVRKLQLGTGPNLLPGWLNTDVFPDAYPAYRGGIVYLDAAQPFPLDDMTFDFVFSEHQIEHISPPQALTMLRECSRILRPGGRVRIATPDLAAIVGLYDEPLDEHARHYVEWVKTTFLADTQLGSLRCHVVNQMFRAYGHQFIFDYDTLAAMLISAGFISLVRWRPGESDDPTLHGIEAHGRVLGDEEAIRFETMVVEAVKPDTE